MSQRISVALCTFNGERFLQEQLQSISNQSRLPDELIVFDDGSVDRTMELLKAFAQSVKFPVYIQQNKIRSGAAENFGHAIGACNAQIISLCDQDDIWEPDKLALTEAAFSNDPACAFVFSDAQICDENCHPLGYRLWQSVGFTSALQQRFTDSQAVYVLLRQNIVTGATLSFASKFRSLILPISGGWMHDGWIALLLSAIGNGRAIERPLVRYRQHTAQSIGALKRSFYQQYLNAKKMDRTVFAQQANQYEAALARLQEQTDFDVPPIVIDHLQQKVQHCRRRSAIRMHQSAKLMPALAELTAGRYHRFSLGLKSFAQDLFL